MRRSHRMKRIMREQWGHFLPSTLQQVDEVQSFGALTRSRATSEGFGRRAMLASVIATASALNAAAASAGLENVDSCGLRSVRLCT